MTFSPSHRRLLAGAAIAIGAMLLGTALVGAVGITIAPSTEAFAGSHDGAVFLTHWQQIASLLATTPARLPGVLSPSSSAPTRLPPTNRAFLVDPGTAGYEAAEWRFSETVGIGVNLEIEMTFVIHYLSGSVPTTASRTVYVETQAAVFGGTLTFTLYWDGGVATGITFVSQFELSQACGSLGGCP